VVPGPQLARAADLVFVLIVCVTGTLAVVSQEIVWLANPQMRASQPSDDARG
jgi:uncharacterized iron-regulated membrane protein